MVALDHPDQLDPPERMETQAAMAILDLREFRDQRVNADPQVFLASRE